MSDLFKSINSNNRAYKIVLGSLIVLSIGLAIFIYTRSQSDDDLKIQVQTNGSVSEVPARLTSEFPEVNYAKAEVDLEEILSGGPGKDGIPALSDPEFESLQSSTIPDTTRGILVSIDGDDRFYPYNILVWHEIVNDQVGGQDIVVTFCPLCGSAVVYNRDFGVGSVEFGVSGFLWESNMIMYDRSDNPTFWSQSIGEGIVGEHTGWRLDLVEFQLLELGEVKQDHPNTKIMSLNTGHSRSYDSDPYGNYDFREDLLFPVSVDDDRYSAKEIFYIVPIENEIGEIEQSIAIRIGEVGDGNTLSNQDLGLTITTTSSGEITVTNDSGQSLPGYFEMWFSWATQHQDDGAVWDPS